MVCTVYHGTVNHWKRQLCCANVAWRVCPQSGPGSICTGFFAAWLLFQVRLWLIQWLCRGCCFLITKLFFKFPDIYLLFKFSSSFYERLDRCNRPPMKSRKAGAAAKHAESESEFEVNRSSEGGPCSVTTTSLAIRWAPIFLLYVVESFACFQFHTSI